MVTHFFFHFIFSLQFVELCPPTADPKLYADMVALRDRRCELDYLILDQNKVIDGGD
jgi:hypothetical protein